MMVADVRTEFRTDTGLFAPVNYDRHCYGPMRYRLALANSLNIPAVKVLASIGGSRPLLQLLQRCGLSTLDSPAEYYGLGLTIGNAEARLLELANAYATIARLGEFRPVQLIPTARENYPTRRQTFHFSDEKKDAETFSLSQRAGMRENTLNNLAPPTNISTATHQIFHPDASYLVADILSDNFSRALAFGAN